MESAMHSEHSENIAVALSGVRDAVFLAIDEVGTTGELSPATWQRLSDNFTVLFLLAQHPIGPPA